MSPCASIRHYTGSLTTPPCQPSDTGKVQWFVMQTPDTVTTEDLFMFTSYFANLDKVRPTEPSVPPLCIIAPIIVPLFLMESDGTDAYLFRLCWRVSLRRTTAT